MQDKRIQRIIGKINKRYLKSRIDITNDSIKNCKERLEHESDFNTRISLKHRICTYKKELARIKADAKLTPSTIVRNIIKLPFIERINLKRHELKIMTKDMKITSMGQNRNLGPYVFLFPNYTHSPSYFEVTRLYGAVDGIHHHPFISGGEFCIGDDEKSSQVDNFFSMGRVDLALQIIWDVLLLNHYDEDNTPFICYSDFLGEIDKRENGETWKVLKEP